jgi:hypothetical protein
LHRERFYSSSGYAPRALSCQPRGGTRVNPGNPALAGGPSGQCGQRRGVYGNHRMDGAGHPLAGDHSVSAGAGSARRRGGRDLPRRRLCGARHGERGARSGPLDASARHCGHRAPLSLRRRQEPAARAADGCAAGDPHGEKPGRRVGRRSRARWHSWLLRRRPSRIDGRDDVRRGRGTVVRGRIFLEPMQTSPLSSAGRRTAR